MRPSSVSAVHIPNAQMTRVALTYPAQEFISEKACPQLKVTKESDKYYKFKKSHLNPVDDLRAIGAKARRIIWEIDSTPTYVCEEHILESLLADRIRDNQDPPIKSEITTTENLVQVSLLGQERRVKALYATKDGAGQAMTAKKWDDADCVSIEADIEAAVDTVKKAFGTKPNTIIMNDDVYRAVRKNPALRNLFKYLPIPAETIFSVEKMFALLFNIPNVIVGGAVFNDANKGAAENLADIWGETVYVTYLEPRPDLMKPSFVYNIFTKRKQMSTRRDEDRDGTVYRIKNIQEEQVICSEACQAILDPLT